MIKKGTIQGIMAFVLIAAFMLPSLVKVTHIFETHEHVVCKDNSSTHFHKEVSDCHICDFHLSTFNYDFLRYPEFSITQVLFKTLGQLSPKLISSHLNSNTQLRAPPVFLS